LYNHTVLKCKGRRRNVDRDAAPIHDIFQEKSSKIHM